MKLRIISSILLTIATIGTTITVPTQVHAQETIPNEPSIKIASLIATSGPTTKYAAIWQKDSNQKTFPSVARHGMTSGQFQSEFDKYVSRGYRLTSVSGSGSGRQTRYAAIWEKRSGPAWVTRYGMTSGQYQAEFNKYTQQGFRLTHISGYGSGNNARYAAIWEKGSGPAWVAHHGMTSGQYQSEFNKYTSQGFRLTQVSGYGTGNQARYAAIWEKRSGPAWVARHGMTSSQYQSEFNKYTSQGFRLTHVSGYGTGNQTRYAAIWEKRSGPAWVARHGMTSGQYQSEFNKYTDQGYQLIHVSGYGQ
ncbi:hypothetical protein IQ260_29845 [Leptolyngbya cf. ectocarpi LEGE 11479]|uniref:Uncharacterized protein n=1 Tax=Leptolyngbya cf. ectocarpi LEGE 11479 TaxID=1828722 RepID=A0A929A0L9_LEPEC|nr:hypothetical protein [Leptolyngbya ectocarpi]MBE9070843.1 hypothetical protein [Leptolyngbya cf. ectocarpi LEGE 11479]